MVFYRIYYFLRVVLVHYLLPDSIHQLYKFRRNHGYLFNLKNPKTLNEKIVWLKLFNRHGEYKDYVDKVKVKEIIGELIGYEFVVPNIAIYNSVDEIDYLNLKYPCVIKSNCGSGDVVLLRDSPDIKKKKLISSLFERSSVRNLYFEKKEHQYHGIDFKIIVEDMLLDGNGEVPNDIKVHCFNGKPSFIYVTKGREGKTVRGIYDLFWNPLNMKWTKKTKKGTDEYCFEYGHYKPENLELILDLAGKIATKIGCPYCRVDFYSINSREIKFGEVTLHHMSGMAPISPFRLDLIYGDQLILTD